MSSSWPRLLVALLFCVVGCSANSNPLGPDAGSGASLAFDDTSVLTLAPGDTASVGIHSSADVLKIAIALSGDYRDAFLSDNSLSVNNGHASLTLQAPTSPTTFSIVAVAGSTSVRRDVSVSRAGFADVRVQANYLGKRAVPVVTASAFFGATCSDLTKAAPTDGAPIVLGTFGETLVLSSLPTDGHLAIAVRIAHYAAGCTDVDNLIPKQTSDVEVDVFDLPFDLANTTLEARLSFTPNSSDAQALQAFLTQSASAVLVAFSASSTVENKLLLDAMASASNSTAFGVARTQKGWDAIAQSWLSSHTPSMHDRTSIWLDAAAQAGVGDLVAHLSSGGSPGSCTFEPKMLGALDATQAGVSAPQPFAWAGGLNDVLQLSGLLTIVPSQLLTAGADVQAHQAFPSATSVADALVSAMDCAGLGAALAGGGNAFGQCDGACMTDLCATAIGDLWSAAAQSLGNSNQILSLTVGSNSPATVGDTADVESYDGTWIGQFTSYQGPNKFATKGATKGQHGFVPN